MLFVCEGADGPLTTPCNTILRPVKPVTRMRDTHGLEPKRSLTLHPILFLSTPQGVSDKYHELVGLVARRRFTSYYTYIKTHINIQSYQ